MDLPYPRVLQAYIDKCESEERLTALISEPSIEAMAEDIAIACVDCRQEIREARHRAMVRLGKRLRDPLPSDIARATLKESARHD